MLAECGEIERGTTYASSSLVPQFIFLGDLITLLVLGDILCDGMVRVRRRSISLDAHDCDWFQVGVVGKL